MKLTVNKLEIDLTNIFLVAQIVLIILRSTEVISWSAWVVFIPTILIAAIPIVTWTLLLLLGTIVVLLGGTVKVRVKEVKKREMK